MPKKELNTKRKTLGGALGGLCESCSLHPLDTIKTRLQLQIKGKSATAYTGMVDCAKTIVRSEGLPALYKGLSPFVVHLVSKYILRFYVNFQIRALLASPSGRNSLLQNMFAGMMAGTIEALMIVTPFEVVKTRLQIMKSIELIFEAQSGAIGAKNAKFRGPVSVLTHILRREGPKGLWRGCAPTVFRQASNQMCMFATYAFLRENLLGDPEELSAAATAGIALVAATVGPLFNCPADVIKTRLMNQSLSMTDPVYGPKYKGFVDAYFKIWREEGYLAMYKGIGPRLARLAPGQAMTWIVVEKFNSFCNAKNILN